MAKSGTADVRRVLAALIEQHASESMPDRTTDVAAKHAIYSSEDVKQMMLNLEKKHADRAGLELAMEELVRRRVAREEMKKGSSGTDRGGGKRRRKDEVATSEDELADHENVGVQNIVEGRRRPAKKVKVHRRRRPSNNVQEGSDNSDSDAEGDGNGEGRRHSTSVVTSKMVGELNEGLKQMVSMLAAFTSRADAPQKQDLHESTQQNSPVHTPKLDRPLIINPTGRDGATSKDCLLDVKASTLDTKPRRSTVEQLFS